VASVLTIYKSSEGNNPYTEAQLKALWDGIEPSSRAPGKYTTSERILLQRTFLEFIQLGYTPTRASQKIKEMAHMHPEKMPYADYATFMAWKQYDKNFSEAYEVAYAMGTDNLEDKAVELAYGGNATMLQFLLRVRSPQRYAPKSEVSGPGGGPIEVINRIEIVAASARPLQIEGQVEDAEVIEDGDR
jgi:hypothetical protein